MPVRQSAVAWCFLLCIISACVPRSERPLSDPATARPDPRLLGTWIGRNVDGEGPVWLHFVEGEKFATEIVMVCPEAGKGADTSFYVMHPTLTVRHSYMNVRSFVPTNLLSLKVGEDLKYPKPEGYLLCKYEITSEGILKIWLLNEDIGEAIQQGRIKGEVRKDEYTKDIVITESTENLLQFFERENHRGFFQLFLICRKVEEKLPQP